MVKCKNSNRKIQILKLKTSGVLKSDYELKIQKQYLHLGFMWTILIHIESAFKYTQ